MSGEPRGSPDGRSRGFCSTVAHRAASAGVFPRKPGSPGFSRKNGLGHGAREVAAEPGPAAGGVMGRYRELGGLPVRGLGGGSLMPNPDDARYARAGGLARARSRRGSARSAWAELEAPDALGGWPTVAVATRTLGGRRGDQPRRDTGDGRFFRRPKARRAAGIAVQTGAREAQRAPA